MSDIVSKDFYSNCLLQALLRKIRHPFKVKLTYIRPKYGESFFFVPHFLWSDGEYDYDFGVERFLKPYEVFWFKGNIRRRSLGWNKQYKNRRIERYRRHHAHNNTTIDVLKENANFIHNKYGYCYYCICDDCSMIYNLYVEPEYRRKGHAKKLIQFAIDEVRGTGYDKEIKIKAEPREDSISMESLVAFYERMGLKVLGE